MKVFVSFDGDTIGQMIGRARLADDVEAVRRTNQAIDHGNEIWRSWCLSHGGSVIEIAGDEGAIEIPADYLDELPKIREQYAEAVGATVSVGVGVKLSESAKALLAAKLRGKDRIEFYTDEVNEMIAAAQRNPQSEQAKIADEYLNKAAPGMNPGAFAGVTEPAGPTMEKPIPTQGDHEEAAAVADQQENSGQSPELTSAGDDFASQFHDAASAQEQEDTAGHAQATKNIDDVKKKLVVALQMLKQQAPMLEQIKQAAPDAYQAIIGLTQAVIGLSREIQAVSPMKKSETEWLDPLLKEENKLDFKRLIHFSVKPGLKQIGVDKMGTGARGAEYKQGVPEVGRAYYYAHNSTPEPLVVQNSKAKYEAHLDPVKHRLYDVGTDPEGLRGASREKFLAGEGLESPEDTFLHEVKSRGYYGYHNSRSSLPHAVALFHPHPVKPLGKAENPRDSMVEAVRGAFGAKKGHDCMKGDCYAATESLHHLFGGGEAGWAPMAVNHETGPHWFLKNRHSGKVVDPMADSFQTPVPYHLGKGKGFVTALPSKRAATVISRVLTRKAEDEENDLKKMAIADIPAGRRLAHGGGYDYTHVLPEQHQQNGYGIYVTHHPMEHGEHAQVRARLTHKGRDVGYVAGHYALNDEGPLQIDNSMIDTEHRGKGLGVPLYEALYAHAKHSLNLTHVGGHEHSTSAGRVHQALSQKHGLDYRPRIDKNKLTQGGSIKEQPFDGRYFGYQYALKNELKAEKDPNDKYDAIEDGDLEKSGLPMPGAPAHHHVTLPVGSTLNQKVKVQHSDGKQGWVSVRAGEVRSQDPSGHPISSRNPGGK